MKNVTTVLSLLVTAILCIGLVSCDRTHDQPEASTAAQTSSEEITTTSESTTDEEFSYEDSSEEGTAAVTVHNTKQPTKPNGNAVINPPTTTKPVTLSPVTTAAPVTTTHPTTTAAPVTTTVPPTTSAPVPTTTKVFITNSVENSEDDDFESAVIRYVNEQRTAQGLSELSYSAELSAAADIRAKEIVESFGHMRTDGTLFNTVSSLAMGENIAKGHNTPQEVMNAWMESDGHRKNILTKQYTLIGVGCYYDQASNTYYWVQLFG